MKIIAAVVAVENEGVTPFGAGTSIFDGPSVVDFVADHLAPFHIIVHVGAGVVFGIGVAEVHKPLWDEVVVRAAPRGVAAVLVFHLHGHPAVIA